MIDMILLTSSILVGLVIVFLIRVFLYGYSPKQAILMIISMCVYAGLAIIVLDLMGLLKNNGKIVHFTVWIVGVFWFVGSILILSRIMDSKIKQ